MPQLRQVQTTQSYHRLEQQRPKPFGKAKDLQGKYEVDFSNLVVNESDNAYTKAFTALFVSAFQMTIQFDERTMIMDGTSAAMQMLMAATDNTSPIVKWYNIINDSVLQVNGEDGLMHPKYIVRKINNSYDYLTLTLYDEDNIDECLILRKVAE